MEGSMKTLNAMLSVGVLAAGLLHGAALSSPSDANHTASPEQLALMRELHPCLNIDNREETVPVDVVRSCPERNVEALVGVSRDDLFSVFGKPTGCRHPDGSSEGWPWPDDHGCRDEVNVYYMFFPPCEARVPSAGAGGPATAILHISFSSAGVVTWTRWERPTAWVGIGRCVPSPTAAGAVQVVGQVAHPSALPYHEGMGVLDAILAAGGLTPLTGGNRAHIVRMENSRETIIRVKLPDGVSRGDQNVPLKPGDVLVVP
jgi:hypothetical protein